MLACFQMLSDQSSFIKTLLSEGDEFTAPGTSSKHSSSFYVDPLFQREYDRIDSTNNRYRCARYGLGYNRGQKKRRIFCGSMVADENYDLVRMHAT